jgi:hypothetical protein
MKKKSASVALLVVVSPALGWLQVAFGETRVVEKKRPERPGTAL